MSNGAVTQDAEHSHPTVPGQPDEPAGTDTVAVGDVDDAPASNFPLWPTDTGTPAPRTHSPVPVRPRRPAVGIPFLVVFALLAALFGWLGAEPAWLALGHADRGTVHVTSCTGTGWTRHCIGDFTAGHRYAVRHVTVAGRPVTAGRSHPARMVSRTGRQAYVGDSAGLTLRWAVPLVLVLLCGLLISVATGAWRLPGRGRTVAVSLSLLGPLLVAAGILAASR